jgi:phosphoribosylformimino-5-aminoimidazole carboxamide ribotide isomerase
MIIYPAIDLMNGAVVRLRQGRFNEATTYPEQPAEALHRFADGGAEWAHIVDLDGARAGRPVQHQLIAGLSAMTSLKLQVGGGFRSRDHVETMLDAGVQRVVIGSLAVKEPRLVSRWIDEFGADRLVLSLDVRMIEGMPVVAVSGWSENSASSLWDVAAQFPAARHLLLTDIGRDGMLSGPNFDLLDAAVRRLPHLKIQASGGVSAITDLERLLTDGAIVGKALWESRFTLEEALSCARR